MTLYQLYTLASRGEHRAILRTRVGLSYGIFAASLILADIVLIIGLSCGTGVAYHLGVYGKPGDLTDFLAVGAIAAGVFLVLNLLQGEYALRRAFMARPRFARTFYLWTLTFTALLILGFLAKYIEVHSRGAVIIYYVVTAPVLFGLRLLAKHMVDLASDAGLLRLQRIFLFGNATSVHEFVRSYEREPNGMTVVGCQFISALPPTASAREKRASLLHDVDAAVVAARSLAPDVVLLLISWSDADAIDACVGKFLVLPTEIHLGPDRIVQRYDNAHLSRFGALTILRLTRVPLNRLDLAAKRAFDIVASTILLFILTPLMVVVAAAIKVDSCGPVFFLQRRYGFNQGSFRIIKFRTMHTMDDGDVVKQAARNDPRVTRVGIWLRRLNIDELPQLFNVIIGDMSLVGPRPHAVAHDREYSCKIAAYARRHNVKPGITGWAQVNGLRGETDTDEKMEQRVICDLYYIENWSLLLDLRILFRTVFSRATFNNAF